MYQSYYEQNRRVSVITKPDKYTSVPFRRMKRNRRNGLPVKRIIALFVCLFLLFCVLTYSFDSFIYDLFPSRLDKNLNINYTRLMRPASGMLSKNAEFVKITSENSKNSTPLMINIPEKHEMTGLRNELLLLADKYRRIHPSIYVWEYSGGNYVNINADETFPAASIIKVPVLIELFRRIESGKFSLYDTMVFEEYYRAGGSGRLKYSEEGREHTLDHLARIMIENSDNSSTNMIISKIGGMPLVNAAIRGWGMKNTVINNWLPDLGGTNTTTARELAEMFYNLDLTDIVSNESKRYIASYLSRVKNTRLLKAGLPKDAVILHKTGDIGYMLGDAGIVKAENGRKYIVVVLAKRPYNSLKGKEFIVKASKLIYNKLAAD